MHGFAPGWAREAMMLRDPVHGLVSFEAQELQIVPKLLATPELQRLRQIRQLGLTSYAYPGADHTRFSHVIGAAHVMTRFIARLREVHTELPFWQRITTERARDAVAAALLHDVGHGPFSHLFEDALPSGPKHEEWSERIVTSEESNVYRVLVEADPGLPARVAQLIRGQHPLTYLAHTVSGMFDVDRCDYLLRDAHFTGVTYGRFDLDWLLRSLRLGQSVDGEAPPLAVDGAKGLPAIESFILARLFMFQQVYFHKASRTSEWMLARILQRVRTLLLDGARLEGVPQGVNDLVLHGETTLNAYVELDDSRLWQSIYTWRSATDSILADLCERITKRRLFKTYEPYGENRGEEALTRLHDIARQLSEERGLNSDVYVGVDESRLIPYEESKGILRVMFPDGSSCLPSEVSFLLRRLNGERLHKRRLILPEEIRDTFVERVGTTRTNTA